MAKRRERVKPRCVGDFAIIDGVMTEINPADYPDLLLRCKIAFANMTTGQKHTAVKSKESKAI